MGKTIYCISVDGRNLLIPGYAIFVEHLVPSSYRIAFRGQPLLCAHFLKVPWQLDFKTLHARVPLLAHWWPILWSSFVFQSP